MSAPNHVLHICIPDRYRRGEVNDGSAVLNGPLTAEYGAGGADAVGLADITQLRRQYGRNCPRCHEVVQSGTLGGPVDGLMG